MDCNEAQSLLDDDSDRTLTAIESAQLGHHVSNCDGCRAVAHTTHDQRAGVTTSSLPTVSPSHYEMSGTIARGGMGRIVRARDNRLGREVAVKEVLSPAHLERFEREAMITARLQHPAIVPIYEAGCWPDGSAFYTMRLVAGSTLTDAIEGASSLEERLEYAANVVAITDAIAFAHSKRVIHRDLKPLNVLVGEFGETVVIDWGLARILGEDEPVASTSSSADRTEALLRTDLTQTGAVIGTPAFMAPEQAEGVPADERTDVYALGAILYTLLVGVSPFRDTHEGVIAGVLMDAIIHQTPTPILKLEPRAPADLVAIAERAMSREPGDRYRDAREMAAELHRFQAGQLLAGREYTTSELLRRWLGRHRAAVTVAAFAALFAIGLGSVALWGIVVSRDNEREARVAAEDARADVESQVADLVFRQAQSSLEHDPTETLAWLRRYPADGPMARGAALLAAEAINRGVSSRVLTSPTSETSSIHLTADSGLVMVGARDGLARLWDVESGRYRDLANVRRDRAHPDPDRRRFLLADYLGLKITFEPALVDGVATIEAIGPQPVDSEWAFTYDAVSGIGLVGLRDGTIGLWRGGEPVTPTGIRGVPVAVVLDGTHFLVLQEQQELLSLHDLDGFAQVGTIAAGGVSESDITPSRLSVSRGKRLVVALSPLVVEGVPRALRIHRWGEPELPALESFVAADVRLSASGAELAVLDEGQVYIIDTVSGAKRCHWKLPTLRPTAFAFAREGDERIIAIGSESGRIAVLTRCGFPHSRIVSGHREEVNAITFSKDARLMASVGGGAQVRLVPIDRAQVLPDATPLTRVCETPLEARVRGEWTWTKCEEAGEQPGEMAIHWAGVSSSGERARMTHGFSTVRISADGATVVGALEDAATINRHQETFLLDVALGRGFHVSASGRRLYRPLPTAIEIWDLDSRRLEETIATPASVVSPAPDETLMLVDNKTGVAIVRRDGTIIAQRTVHLLGTSGIAWSADSQVVAARVSGSALLVYRRATNTWSRLVVDPELGSVQGFSVSPSGRTVASATSFGVAVWDVASGVCHDLVTDSRLGNVAWRARFVGEHAIILNDAISKQRMSLPDFSHAMIEKHTDAIITDGRLTSKPR